MPKPGKTPSVETLVQEFLSGRAGEEIRQESLGELQRFVSSRREGRPPSPARLLDILLSTNTAVSRSIGGFAPDLRGRVRIHDLDSSQESLIEMANEYERARSTNDQDRAFDCRRAVLHSKKRLAFLLARPNLSEEKRREKMELQQWFRVWLEAPGLFEAWADLRRRSTSK